MNVQRNFYKAGLISGISALAFFAAVEGWAEEGVFLDPQTGDYLLRYEGLDGSIKETFFYPQTKIIPIIKSKIQVLKDGSLAYRYQVKNGENSRQNLDSLMLHASQAEQVGQSSSLDWNGRVISIPGEEGVAVSWSTVLIKKSLDVDPSIRLGLPPGSSFSEFTFRSSDLPGIGLMRLYGKPLRISGYPDEGPDPESAVGKKIGELEASDFVPMPAAVPRIPVTTPFDAAVTLSGLQKHIKKDLLTMKLVDPTFAAKLDALLQTAIDAAKAGATGALTNNLKYFRQAIQQASPGVGEDDDDGDDGSDDDNGSNPNRLIDKLAARVLFFDVKYIEKRLSGNKQDQDD